MKAKILIGKSRKAQLLGVLIIVGIFISLITFASLVMVKTTDKPRQEFIGQDQLAILKTASKAERALLYVDQAAKLSVSKAIYDLAENGGIYDDASGASNCGIYYDYYLWQGMGESEGKVTLNKCYPSALEMPLGRYIDTGLTEYFSGYGAPLSEFSVSYSYTLKEGMVNGVTSSKLDFPIAIGEMEAKPITTTQVETKNLFSLADSFVGSPYVFGGKEPAQAEPWKSCSDCIRDMCHERCLKGSTECSKCIYKDQPSSAWSNECKGKCSMLENCPLQCIGQSDTQTKICPQQSSSPNTCWNSGFDCSGLVNYVYKTALGIEIGQGTKNQYSRCVSASDYSCEYIPIASPGDLEKLQPGDILFFDNGGQRSGEKTCNTEGIHHVVLYIGKESGEYRTYEAMATKNGILKGFISAGRMPCGGIRIKTESIKNTGENQNLPVNEPNKMAAGETFIVLDGDYDGKGSSKLYLVSNSKVVGSYEVAIGINGMGKTKEGDKKTPVGTYYILWKASVYSAEDGGYKIEENKAFCGPDNIFTTDPNVGYKSESLWTDGYGGDQAVVMGLDYPNKEDKAKGYSGSCIEIHASKFETTGKQSAGCIRLKPDEAKELYKAVKVGAKVVLENGPVDINKYLGNSEGAKQQ